MFSDRNPSCIFSSFNPQINLSRNALLKNVPNLHVEDKCLRQKKKKIRNGLTLTLTLISIIKPITFCNYEVFWL